MECKDAGRFYDFVCDPRFNRYIVECKGHYHAYCNMRSPDLIDTLWNVKPIVVTGNLLFCLDLIDTLWNVKLRLPYSQFVDRSRFNRYIVECKARNDTRTIRTVNRFNRYIVECKDWYSQGFIVRNRRFNRYIVECKAYGISRGSSGDS